MTYDVTPADIRRHATAVSTVATTLGQMKEASSVSGDSYGLLLSWLPGWINGTGDDVKGTLDQVATNAAEAVNGLRVMADQYETDDQNAVFELRTSYP
ncbi:type VII secretion target [Knoellia sp. S7-12]|uniref:type VII secretion target n=1 Tax=Knoellia sp. S7-12 TaxID=3126698 RepID=UPI00336773F7